MSRAPSLRQPSAPPAAPVSGRSAATAQKPAPKRPDRRVQRTRRLLHQALVRLIQERGWDAVTVQDVCERADVGRSTFYVHFADKEELLVSGFADLRAHLRESAGTGPLAFTHALLEHTRNYAPIYRALLGRRTAQVAQRAWIEVVTDLLAEDLHTPASPLRDATLRALAGALWELVGWTLEHPRRAAAVEPAALFRRLAAGALRDLARA